MEFPASDNIILSLFFPVSIAALLSSDKEGKAHFTSLHCTALCRTVLYFTTLYCTVLYCT
jgi:hypothetical protein